MWTMDELVERVREALAAEYSGAGDGRIRDVPDRRAVRWYTTIGLVDRPLGMRGRSALYGPRHLQQLVAIKRQQAVGRSLSQIQADFTWLSDDGLAELSDVPERLLEADGPQPEDAADDRHMRFWARPPAQHEPTRDERQFHTPKNVKPPYITQSSEPQSSEPQSPEPQSPEPQSPEPPRAKRRSAKPPGAEPQRAEPPGGRPQSAEPPRATAAPPQPRPVNGVVLRGGAILLVPRPLSERDREDLAAAAAPLLDLLEDRGLLDGRSA